MSRIRPSGWCVNCEDFLPCQQHPVFASVSRRLDDLLTRSKSTSADLVHVCDFIDDTDAIACILEAMISGLPNAFYMLLQVLLVCDTSTLLAMETINASVAAMARACCSKIVDRCVSRLVSFRMGPKETSSRTMCMVLIAERFALSHTTELLEICSAYLKANTENLYSTYFNTQWILTLLDRDVNGTFITNCGLYHLLTITSGSTEFEFCHIYVHSFAYLNSGARKSVSLATLDTLAEWLQTPRSVTDFLNPMAAFDEEISQVFKTASAKLQLGALVFARRITEVAIALQSLELPVLLTLEIVDALLPNQFAMHIKWRTLAAVKHFRERKQ